MVILHYNIDVYHRYIQAYFKLAEYQYQLDMAAKSNVFCFLDESCSNSVPTALACCTIRKTEQSWASSLKQGLAGIRGFQMEHTLMKVIKASHVNNDLDFSGEWRYRR